MSKIVFTYRGVNGQGSEARGTVEAVDKQDALTKLRLLESQGLRNLSIESAATQTQEENKSVAEIKNEPHQFALKPWQGWLVVVCIGIMTWSQIVTPKSPALSASSAKSSENDPRNYSLEYKLATNNAGTYVSKDHITVARFRNLLEQLSSKFVENKDQIANITVSIRQTMREKDGVEESLLNMMEGMNQLFPRKIDNQKYVEYIAHYSMLRSKGKSHSEAISGLQEILQAGYVLKEYKPVLMEQPT